MGRLSVLSPRRLDRELEDWGGRRALGRASARRPPAGASVPARTRRLAPVGLGRPGRCSRLSAAAGTLGAPLSSTSPRFAVAERWRCGGASRLCLAEEIIAASGIRARA